MKPNRLPSITGNLALAFVVLIAILLGIGWLGLSRMAQMNRNIQEITDHRWQKVQLSREALRYSNRNSRITMLIFLLQDREAIDPLLAERAENTGKISELLKKIEADLETDDEKKLIARVWATRIPYIEGYKGALDLLLKEGQPEAGRAMMGEVVTPNLLAYHKAWEDFVDHQGGRMNQAGDEAEAHYAAARRQVFALLALALSLAGAVAVFVTRGMARAIASRVRAEEDLREAHDVLERRVEGRTEELTRAHKELVALSREAGMAEVATSVLHNVGNVLNSVNVALSVATDKVSGLKVATLERMAALLREQRDLAAFFTSDPRGAELPAFLASVAERLGSDRAAVLGELGALRQHIEHVNEIVAMQQSYANACGVTEVLPLTDLIEDALRMNSGAIDRHGLRVVREFAEVPPLPVDRHKVLQILVNLIRNAKYALDDGNPADKRLTLRLGLNGGGCAKISVSDNGIGIPAENLTRIFGHGFTTRKNGHGFGLHSGANAAREMGGSLSVQSDGPGRGATFTLELPIADDRRPTTP